MNKEECWEKEFHLFKKQFHLFLKDGGLFKKQLVLSKTPLLSRFSSSAKSLDAEIPIFLHEGRACRRADRREGRLRWGSSFLPDGRNVPGVGECGRFRDSRQFGFAHFRFPIFRIGLRQVCPIHNLPFVMDGCRNPDVWGDG